MKHLHLLILSCIAAYGLTAQAADDELFPDKIHFPSEQTVGRGQTVLWTLPNIATQYQPRQSVQALRDAIAAQWDGRILDAQIMLDEARKAAQAGSAERAEIDLLNVSFLLQGDNPRKALELLPRYFDDARFSADAHAQAAMAHLALGQAAPALKHAQLAHAAGRNAFLPNMAMSYALQSVGQLAEAYRQMHDFNRTNPESAMALAHEAELALMLDRSEAGRDHAIRAHELDATNPYVSSVYGLMLLIDGRGAEAANAFDAALRHDPHDAKALLGKALAELHRGDNKAGLRLLEEAHDADPGNAIILTYLGAAQQQTDQREAAMASWRSARQADPLDPSPWLYQARAELQDNRPMAARESMREARGRMDNRSVYRGARLLQQDAQLYQSIQADIQRQLGMAQRAALDLATLPGRKDGNTLRNLADLLQGQRFGESARRSLLLQSLFDAEPGRLPEELDIYGDGAGQTGATTPQHGEVSGLHAQRLSYNDYDSLFASPTKLAVDATAGSRNSLGGQLRFGTGNDTLGVSLAHRQHRTDGFDPYDSLDNHISQGVLQWRPRADTQFFLSHQTFASRRGETFMPADIIMGAHAAIADDSQVSRIGLRRSIGEAGELRALLSSQRTAQHIGFEDFSVPPFTFTQDGSSRAESIELQYRHSNGAYTTQWGVQQVRGQLSFSGVSDTSLDAQHAYAKGQISLHPHWLLDAGLGWGRIVKPDNLRIFTDNTTRLERWLPQLGLAWMPDDATRLNFAVWQGMGIPSVGDAALTPTTLAGVALYRPGDERKLVQALALDGWQRLGADWSLEAGAQRRDRNEPAITMGVQQFIKYRQDAGRLALHWQAAEQPWQATLAQEYERFDWLSSWFPLDSVRKQRLNSSQLRLRWFASANWTLGLDLSHNKVDGMQTSLLTPDIPYGDRFDQADASLGWQAGPASISAGVRNATAARFQYADPDRLNPRFSPDRLYYAKLKLDW
ncbi:MAG TPA: hypothetical protein VFF26_13110 [Gallionella sp.]|nr:hypothetical protein [Gallionella sp.]